VERRRERRGACRVFEGKYESKGPLGRHRSGWVDNIKVDLEELECST